jgi:hypothetical protein
MNLLQDDLAGFGARPVWFNAWHHHEEAHLFAALLENIRAQAIPPFHTWSALTFRLRLLWHRLRGGARRLLVLGLLALLFGVVANWALDGRLDDVFHSLWPGDSIEDPATSSDVLPAGEGADSNDQVPVWVEKLGAVLRATGFDPKTGIGA